METLQLAMLFSYWRYLIVLWRYRPPKLGGNYLSTTGNTSQGTCHCKSPSKMGWHRPKYTEFLANIWWAAIKDINTYGSMTRYTYYGQRDIKFELSTFHVLSVCPDGKELSGSNKLQNVYWFGNQCDPYSWPPVECYGKLQCKEWTEEKLSY